MNDLAEASCFSALDLRDCYKGKIRNEPADQVRAIADLLVALYFDLAAEH